MCVVDKAGRGVCLHNTRPRTYTAWTYGALFLQPRLLASCGHLSLPTCLQIAPGSEGAALAAALTGFFDSLVDCLSSQPESTTGSSEEATGAWQRTCRVQSNLDSGTTFAHCISWAILVIVRFSSSVVFRTMLAMLVLGR